MHSLLHEPEVVERRRLMQRQGVRREDVVRVLETSHPPVYYIPPEDIRMEHLEPAGGASFCEWKGAARY